MSLPHMSDERMFRLIPDMVSSLFACPRPAARDFPWLPVMITPCLSYLWLPNTCDVATGPIMGQ
jgi:hypothetical protein